jgi:hypothetical protein
MWIKLSGTEAEFHIPPLPPTQDYVMLLSHSYPILTRGNGKFPVAFPVATPALEKCGPKSKNRLIQ